jgi:hypothetical protein
MKENVYFVLAWKYVLNLSHSRLKGESYNMCYYIESHRTDLVSDCVQWLHLVLPTVEFGILELFFT